MSRENVVGFFEKLVSDTELQKKLQAAIAAASERAMLDVAKAHGFSFDEKELSAHVAEKAAELGDDEQEKAAGGLISPGAGSQSYRCMSESYRCMAGSYRCMIPACFAKGTPGTKT